LVQQEVAFGKQLMEEMNGFLFLIVFKSSAVGAITVAPSDANVVYVGMGEADMRSNISLVTECINL
jgi:hypothetical protein